MDYIRNDILLVHALDWERETGWTLLSDTVAYEPRPTPVVGFFVCFKESHGVEFMVLSKSFLVEDEEHLFAVWIPTSCIVGVELLKEA